MRISRLKSGLFTAVAPAIIHSATYANTLTAILPDIWAAMDVVSRELVGYIPSAMRAPGAERAAVGQSVTYPIAPAQSAQDTTPAMQVPNPPDNTWTVGTMTISKSRQVPFGFTGEEQKALNAGYGPGYLTAQGQAVAQALRTLCNEIENDLGAEAVANASRAVGTAGTTPFGSDTLGDIAQLRKVLNNNGAPAGRSLVLNADAAANMLSNVKNLTRVNEAGDQMTLRQGEIGMIFGFSTKESNYAGSHTSGTAASATTNSAGYAVGAETITLAATGTGAFVPGEVITFAGDTNKYVVVTGDADVSNGGTITIAKPGLRQAIPTSATAITRLATYTASVGFSQDALHLVTRAPAKPVEGDLALDRMTVTDPRSGLTFEFSVWPGYRMVRIEVAIAWGVKASKREHIVLLLG